MRHDTAQKKYYGFTLIEVLVAATIVALLSTIGLAGFQKVTQNGRDAVRKADLEQIRSALEIYKSEYGSYPEQGDLNGSHYAAPVLIPDYMPSWPSDPKSALYKYVYIKDVSTNLKYYLCAHLENGPNSDIDQHCSGNICANAGSVVTFCNYKVTNP